MTTSTALEIYTALSLASFTPILVDALNQIIYYENTVTESDVHEVIDSLGWVNATILLIETSDDDPYSQYLNVSRHDHILRHPVGTVVPHDSTKINLTYLILTGRLQPIQILRLRLRKPQKHILMEKLVQLTGWYTKE